MNTEKSVFETLFDVNVNEHIEKKNGLSYLSWAFAWAETKKKYPNAKYIVYENSKGMFYHTDGKTCWVKTGVTINDLEYIEYLPVMDYKNRSIPFESVTSFDVNKTVQRSLTKALARHGLGLYIYAGEDLPEVEIEKIDVSEQKKLKELIDSYEDAEKVKASILNMYKIKNFTELSKKQYQNLVERISN